MMTRSTRPATATYLGLVGTLCLVAATTATPGTWPPAPPIEARAVSEDTATLPRSIAARWVEMDTWKVTFRFRPEMEARRVALVGTFNNWERETTPMAGPNADGEWTVEVSLPTGVHQYKFLIDEDTWRADPANTEQVPDGHGGFNSFVRLGRLARLAASDAKVGDQRIDASGLMHRAPEPLYIQQMSPTLVSFRYRTLTNDVQKVTFAIQGEKGAEPKLQPMEPLAVGPMFTYWETKVEFPPPPAERREPTGITYTFVLEDGGPPVGDPYSYYYTHMPRAMLKTPEWTRDAIWYQIIPDRFRNGDPANDPDPVRPWTSEWFTPSPWEGKDGQTFYNFFAFARFYGGDLAGIEEKLPYLKELGVNALYLTPIFAAPSYHKYDVANFIHVDDRLGVKDSYEQVIKQEDLLNPATWQWTESDKRFLAFVRKAKQMGFHVVLDAVFNHCGDDHPAFRDVRQVGKQSRFADWFDVTSWQPFAYRGWAGFAHMPVFKKDANGFASDSLKKHLFAVTQRWMDPDGDGDPSDGIDGWRLDVPNDIPRPFWAEWRAFVKKINPDAFITGEVWHRADQWLDGEHFDAVMNYEFARTAVAWIFDRQHKIPASAAAGRLHELQLAYPAAATYSLQSLVDSHDTDRLASMAMNPDREYDRQNRVQDNNPDYNQERPTEEAYARARLATLLQMTYVGAPLLYYGNEAGMWGADDPSNRKPMLWADLEPYEKPEENFVHGEQLAFFKQAAALRKQHSALRRGTFSTLLTDDQADVWAFLREDDRERVIVLLNASGKDAAVAVPLPAGAPSQWNVALGPDGPLAAEGGTLRVSVPAVGGVVLHASK